MNAPEDQWVRLYHWVRLYAAAERLESSFLHRDRGVLADDLVEKVRQLRDAVISVEEAVGEDTLIDLRSGMAPQDQKSDRRDALLLRELGQTLLKRLDSDGFVSKDWKLHAGQCPVCGRHRAMNEHGDTCLLRGFGQTGEVDDDEKS